MEQRIGSSSQPLKSEPVKGAGFDPAFVPGLTSPVPAQDAAPEEPGTTPPADGTAPAGPAGGARGAAPDESGDPAESAESAESPGGGTSSQEAEAPDGPVFEAADRRARIVADHRGVRLALDDQDCEFRWDEIGAVETATSRFGKRFTVVVHTPDRRWYPIEIEAPARSRFGVWEAELDAVLDAYFEDGEADGEETGVAEKAEPEEAEAESKTESEAESEAESKPGSQHED
ncbi:hypothetical protein [Streptomyces sp. NPDC056160]|uniref:hypothetical protein n=1 Tax=Streptomyces sp. NPDC056160 TaxID=3345731 RepID=UPI0035E16D3E